MHMGFNRDIVECKEDLSHALSGYRNSFNRDIVECKDRFKYRSPLTAPGFNRDIVECKVSICIRIRNYIRF